MEHFKREDNFEDFCLAMFQQIENIVIYLFNKLDLKSKVLSQSNQYIIFRYNSLVKEFTRDTRGLKVGELIFQKYKTTTPINIESQKWYHNHKFRTVLYYNYFNGMIEYNTNSFESIYGLGNELYQLRNLNHRGSTPSDYQKNLYKEILPMHNKYYFRFLGFLEDFVTGINKNLD